MKLWVTGIGWAAPDALGSARNKIRLELGDEKSSTLSWAAAFDKPCPKFHRLDDYSRLGMAAISLALKDAGRETWAEKRNIAIAAQTVYGCLATDFNYYQTVIDPSAWPSPGLFAYTLPNCVLGDAAIHFGLSGPSFILAETASPSLAGLLMAADMLELDEAESVLWGVCDLGRPEFMDKTPDISALALFFMIEKPGSSHFPPLNVIHIDQGRVLDYRGTQIADYRCLFEASLV